MIRHPYGPDELDRTDPALDGIAEQLQTYASDQRSGPPLDLAARIHAAIEVEPDPAVGWWARFTSSMVPWATPTRGLAAVAVVAAAVIVALVVGDLANLVRGPISPGSSPSPSFVIPSPTPFRSSTPSVSPSPSPSPSSEPSQTSSPRPSTPAPSATDDDDRFETPEPSESDNSGPGGGGNSGPGGGGSGDDNSGPGGGG
jgi:hypothetical protein